MAPVWPDSPESDPCSPNAYLSPCGATVAHRAAKWASPAPKLSMRMRYRAALMSYIDIQRVMNKDECPSQPLRAAARRSASGNPITRPAR